MVGKEHIDAAMNAVSVAGIGNSHSYRISVFARGNAVNVDLTHKTFHGLLDRPYPMFLVRVSARLGTDGWQPPRIFANCRRHELEAEAVSAYADALTAAVRLAAVMDAALRKSNEPPSNGQH